MLRLPEAPERRAALRGLLRAAEGLAEAGASVELATPVELDGAEFATCTLVKRFKSKSSPALVCLSGAGERSTNRLLKREDVRREWAAMGCLSLINRRWSEAGRAGFEALVYGILPVGRAGGLVQMVEDCQTLDRLKRDADAEGRGREHRVSAFLGAEPAALTRLALSTAAYLASNYYLGVCDGHGDNVMLRRDGVLFRIDFDYIFGTTPTIPFLAVPFDSPVVWLPEAVIITLQEAGLWESVLRDSQDLLHDLIHGPSEFHCRMLAACTYLDDLCGTCCAAYVARRSEDEFREALQRVQGSFMKRLKTTFHFQLGYASRQQNFVEKRESSDSLSDELVINVYQALHSDLSGCLAPLVQSLKAGDITLQIMVLAVLAELGDLAAEHVDSVAQLLTSTEGAVRRAALVAASELQRHPEDNLGMFLAALKDSDATVRRAAVRIVSTVGTTRPEHVGAIADLLQDPSAAVRISSAVALANWGSHSQGQLHALLKALPDAEPTVRIAVVRALGRSGLGGAAAEAVLGLLGDHHATVRSASVDALAQMPGSDARRAGRVARLLTDGSVTVRGAAAHALAKMEDAGADHADAVASLLLDGDESVRAAATEALAGMGLPGMRHAAAVATLLMDTDAKVRHAAQGALVRMARKDGAASNSGPNGTATSDDADRSAWLEVADMLARIDSEGVGAPWPERTCSSERQSARGGQRVEVWTRVGVGT